MLGHGLHLHRAQRPEEEAAEEAALREARAVLGEAAGSLTLMAKGAAVPSRDPDFDKYRAESDCRTLHDADEIRRDSSRHSAAKKHAGKQLRIFRRIAT